MILSEKICEEKDQGNAKVGYLAFTVFAITTYIKFYIGNTYPYPTAFGMWSERCQDFTTYVMASKGDTEYERTIHNVRGWHPDFPIGWLYWNPLRFLWYPFTFLPLQYAHLIWYCIQVISICYVYSKLCEIPNGWIITLASFKIAQIHFLNGGNVTPILLALVLTPIGALVAGLFKPQLFGFALLHGILRFNNTLEKRSNGGRYTFISTLDHYSFTSWMALANSINRTISAVHLHILGR